MKYYVVYVNIVKDNVIQEIPFLSDEILHVGDVVEAEGIVGELTVAKTVEYDDHNMPYNVTHLKKIVGYKPKGERVRIDAKIDNVFSYADYHVDTLSRVGGDGNPTGISFIKGLMLVNEGNKVYDNLTLEFHFSNGAFNAETINLPALTAFSKETVHVPFIYVSLKNLEAINEITAQSLDIVLRSGEDVIADFHHIYYLLPLSVPSIEARYDFRHYLKYIAPNNKDVRALAIEAIKYNDNKEIVAYQNADMNDIRRELNAIYLAIHNAGIAYQNPPAGGLYYDKTDPDAPYSQRIRRPSEIIRGHSGTCLDIAMLYCAVLESVGYNPIFIVNRTHAFIGVYTKDREDLTKDIFDNGILTNPTHLYNYTTGSDEILVINSVMVTSLNNASFTDAIESGTELINGYDDLFFAYDVEFLHRGIFRPIPESDDDNIEAEIKATRIKGDISPVENIQYIEVNKAEDKDRFTFWEKKLLDLTEANVLVNFNPNSNNSVRIAYDGDFTEMLNEDKIKLLDPIKAEKVEDLDEVIRRDYKPKDLLLDYDSSKVYTFGIDKTLKNIINKSKSATDETGAPTLYLIMGMLKYERMNRQQGMAPFMVLPVKITKNKNKPGYTMAYDYEDVMINQTFFEYYSLFHEDSDYSSLYGINANDKYRDICHTFKMLNNGDITLNENVFMIANLTFSHYIMWLDMKKRHDELKKNKVVLSILENKNMLDEVPDLDTEMDPEDYSTFAAPLPYDSTQLEAIKDCAKGKSFILDGPPGTGKSQTIVNMIVNAFYNGKTVLFVAEKKAALDVVAERLEKIKLGRFALELHSNKANKADFFAKLKSSMEIGETAKDPEFNAKCRDLLVKKDELSRIINKMHEKRYFLSLYDAIISLENHKDIDGSFNIPDSVLIKYTEEDNNKATNLLRELVSHTSEIHNYDNSLAKYVGLDKISFYDAENIHNDFKKLAAEFDDLYYDIEKLVKASGLEAELNQPAIADILVLLDLALNKELYMKERIAYYEDYNEELIDSVFSEALKLNELNKAGSDYKLDLIKDIDYKSAIDEINNTTGFFKKLKVKGKYKKILEPVLNIKPKKNLVSYFEFIGKYNECSSYIDLNKKNINNLIGDDIKNHIGEINRVKDAYLNTKELVRLCKHMDLLGFDDLSYLFADIYEAKSDNLRNSLAKVNKELASYKVTEAAVTDKYAVRYKYLDIHSFRRFNEYMSMVDINELTAQARINNILAELDSMGLNVISDAIINGSVKALNLGSVFDKSIAENIIRLYFLDDEINYFNPSYFENEIKRYRELINEYNNIVIEEVSAKLTAKLNHNSVDYLESSPIGRLKKAIQSSGRGTTIRETLLNYDSIMKSYFPVFLMSPLSAAQYLSVDNSEGKGVSKFDIVIFDEASQIPTHEAIGPIARGKSLIVAGDPMQMPPSSYFQAGINYSEDDIEFEDADSLLNECLSIDMPRHQLKFHYRSHHESLIEFSNQNYYNSSLYTFPSSDSDSFKVAFKYVYLKEEKKNTNLSKEESDEIINTIKEIYDNPDNKDRSLGIIVFNIKQEEALEAKLQTLMNTNKEFRDKINYAAEVSGEPLFVKSLENVQGDERDIIILSVGFRKNSLGRPYVNGPLVRINGEKRLNVAVSRSKEQMIVISTIKSSDFEDDERITSLGAKKLKYFLSYAERNTYVSNYKSGYNDEFAINIAEDLRQMGYEVKTGVGSGRLRVDVAIKRPNSENYELGIIVDNSANMEGLSLRDRLYVNDYMLNNLKWKIINIYSIEYFKNKKAVLARIVDAIDNPYIKKSIELKPEILVKEKKEIKLTPDEYINIPLFGAKYDKETGFINLESNLKLLVSAEGPISLNLVKARVRAAYHLKALSPKMSNEIEQALNQFSYTFDQFDKFYWGNQDNYMSNFRLAGGRDIQDVSKEELIACMRQIIRMQGGMVDADDLFHAVLDAFEFESRTLNKRCRERLEYAYSYGLKERLID